MNNIIDDKVKNVIDVIKNMDAKKNKTWIMYEFKCLY